MSCDTLCWKCQKAGGKCSWSKCFEPVEGWDAKPTKVIDYCGGKQIITDSFNVRHCPEFVKDR